MKIIQYLRITARVTVIAAVILAVFSYSQQHQPKTVWDYYQQGKQYGIQKKYDEAITSYKKALTLDPNFHRAYINLSYVYSKLGETDLNLYYSEKALSYIDQMEKLANKEVSYYNYASANESIGELETAWTYYRKALEHRSGVYPDLWKEDKDKWIYYVINDDKETYLKKAQGYKKSNKLDWRIDNIVKPDYYAGRYDKIIDDYDQYIKDNPRSPVQWRFRENAIWAMLGKGDYESAIQELRDHLKEDSLSNRSRAWSYESLAHAYRKLGLYQQALAYVDLTRETFPDEYSEKEALYDKSYIYKDNRDLLNEKKVLLQIIDRDINLDEQRRLEYRLGEVEAFLGNYNASYEYWESKYGKLMYMFFCILGVLLMAGIFMVIFYALYGAFFRKKHDEGVRKSGFQPWHLFVVLVMTGIFSWFFPLGVMVLNYYVIPLGSILNINPMWLGESLADLSLIALVLGYFRWRQISVKDFGFVSRGWKINLGLPVLVLIGIFAWDGCYEWVLNYFNQDASIKGYLETIFYFLAIQENYVGIIFWIFHISVLSVIAQELFFRSFLITFLNPYLGIRGAVILSSAMFAVYHGQPILWPYYFVVGLVLAMIYVRTKSIVPVMVAHMLNNVLCFVFW